MISVQPLGMVVVCDTDPRYVGGRWWAPCPVCRVLLCSGPLSSYSLDVGTVQVRWWSRQHPQSWPDLTSSRHSWHSVLVSQRRQWHSLVISRHDNFSIVVNVSSTWPVIIITIQEIMQIIFSSQWSLVKLLMWTNNPKCTVFYSNPKLSQVGRHSKSVEIA